MNRSISTGSGAEERLAELLSARLPGDGPIGEAWILSDRDDHASCVANGLLKGQTIKDRGSQITFSALGQQAPLEEKKKWDPHFTKRKKIKSILDTSIPKFSVRMGGATSVDITRPGIDKAYGVHTLKGSLWYCS